MEQEQQRLKQYASIANQRILESQSDLDPKDRAMPDMLTWCRHQGSIVVLQSGSILCNDPASRLIQNCKVVMHNKGLTPGVVYPAASSLINILLENGREISHEENKQAAKVSTQQQRLRMLVKEAIDFAATDIHIEVRNDLATIRFRKHGELVLHAEWLSKLAREIASVAFNKETDHAITHFNPLIPQNASMPLKIGNRSIRLRLASLPAQEGFDMVMRILASTDEKIKDLASLGYLPEQIELIKKAVRMPHGAVIVAGPTGSGKTTTLASCMQLVSNQRKVYTIEDPIEKLIPNITQVPVNTEKYDRSFASMARTALRMDPDVIVLGEMRDEDSASVMVRAAVTGHLIFSTVHTNTSTDIITRLVDLGISRSLLSTQNLLVCLICQRLAPILCKHCHIPIQQSLPHRQYLSRWKATLGKYFSQIKTRGSHCKHCHNQGISHRSVAAEVVWLDAQGRDFIQKEDIPGWRRHLKKHGWVTYQQRLIEMVKAGLCDPLDIENIIGAIDNLSEDESFNYNADVGS